HRACRACARRRGRPRGRIRRITALEGRLPRMRAAPWKGWLLATMLAATGPAAATHPAVADDDQVASTHASPGSAPGTAATDTDTSTPAAPAALPPPGSRNGLEIYENFRDGLAQPECEADASALWRQHFAN